MMTTVRNLYRNRRQRHDRYGCHGETPSSDRVDGCQAARLGEGVVKAEESPGVSSPRTSWGG